MKTVGIICEYNPLHLGHRKQIAEIRRLFSPDCAVVCLMSGNFVQRGKPAIIDKTLRAKAAIRCGADLVLELPAEYALSSAEGFAAGGVRILKEFCDGLCFGAEYADKDTLMNTAKALLSEEFRPLLKAQLEKGCSFPTARQLALEQMGLDGSILESPNNILAVEYCKAILSQKAQMEPLPIFRGGNYHDELPDTDNPSATAVRNLMLGARDWKSCIPEAIWDIYETAAIYDLRAGDRAILAKLRTMTDAEFENLPYGSEGLWRKLMHASRSCATLEEIIAATKSKRYTRTRIDRMILCAFLGLSLQDLLTPPPYVRILAFTDHGRSVLRQARKTGTFLNAGEIDLSPYGEKERRTGALYELFAVQNPGKPDCELTRRIYYQKEN